MDNHLNHIHLFGNPSENFYVLGKRDKTSFQEVYHQISMLCARNNYLAKIIKTSTELSRRYKNQNHSSNYIDELSSYAEGLEKPLDDVLFAMLLPEVVASFNKWTPNLLSIIPGCSSLFQKDSQTGGVIHTRILDYALSGPFEKYERSVLYDFKDKYKVFSLSTSGLALPAISGMNEKGLTVAIHYKHGSTFDLDGQSIFSLASNVLFYCADIREVIKYLKNQQSISYWGLYLSDASGNVASVDISGNEFYQQKFDINDHDYLYFNNRPIIKKNEHTDIQPYGNMDQCHMRSEIIRIKLQGQKTTTTLDSLKNLSGDFKYKSKTAKDWKLAPTTPSSIQAFSFNYKADEIIALQGDAPKFFNNEYLTYTSIFSETTLSKKKSKAKQNNYIKGYKSLAKTQSAIDLGDISLAYHEIQMAIEYFKGYPEYYISKFFFSVLKYIYESDKRDMTYLFHEFESYNGKLPAYLQDQNFLFILRSQIIIGHKVKSDIEKMNNLKLKQLYAHELKLNGLGIKGLKNFIFPRIEILDIIYSY